MGKAEKHPDDLAARTDELLRRASALRQRCEQLGERLETLTGSRPPVSLPAEPAEGIRIVATNLVLEGADREAVDALLRDEFGRTDNEALLDDVFAAAGRGSNGERKRRFVRRA